MAKEGDIGDTVNGETFGERGKRRFAKCPKWVIIKLSKYHAEAFPASKRATSSERKARRAGSGAWTKEAKRERAGFVHEQREQEKAATSTGRRGHHAGSGAWTKEAKRERAGYVHEQREREKAATSTERKARRAGSGAWTKRRSGSEPVMSMSSGAGQRPSRQSITAGGGVADGQITFKPQISPRRKGSAVRG